MCVCVCSIYGTKHVHRDERNYFFFLPFIPFGGVCGRLCPPPE